MLNPAGLTQPECFANAINRVNSCRVPELIEVGVTGMSNRLDQILFPMHAPAMHVGVAIRYGTRTSESGFGQVSRQPGQSSNDFVGGTRRIRSGCPIGKWIGLRIFDRLPILGRNRWNKLIRIK